VQDVSPASWSVAASSVFPRCDDENAHRPIAWLELQTQLRLHRCENRRPEIWSWHAGLDRVLVGHRRPRQIEIECAGEARVIEDPTTEVSIGVAHIAALPATAAAPATKFCGSFIGTGPQGGAVGKMNCTVDKNGKLFGSAQDTAASIIDQIPINGTAVLGSTVQINWSANPGQPQLTGQATGTFGSKTKVSGSWSNTDKQSGTWSADTPC
jgi:hypothetical protein